MQSDIVVHTKKFPENYLSNSASSTEIHAAESVKNVSPS